MAEKIIELQNVTKYYDDMRWIFSVKSTVWITKMLSTLATTTVLAETTNLFTFLTSPI